MPSLPVTDPIAHWYRICSTLAASGGAGDGAHDLAHVHRVWANAHALLAAHPRAESLVVLAACLLHDVVNPPKDHPDRARASRLAAAHARTQPENAGFPAHLLAGVVHAIEAHSFSAAIAPRTLEAQIVQDADRLDALGAVGLARLFYTAGRMGSALAHETDPLAAARPLDDRAFALDHIAVKLAALPGRMHTAAARALAHARLRQIERFRTDFAAEWSPAPATSLR
jgi:uncharacterized protein